MEIELEDGRRAPIIQYLRDGVKLTFKEEVKKLKHKASHYLLIDGVLYKQGHSIPLLRCLDSEEADYVLKEIHERICDNHSRGGC